MVQTACLTAALAISALSFGQDAQAAVSYGDPILGIGSKSGQVSALQQDLRVLGYFTYQTNTGYYGTITETAVRAFQRAHGLAENGKVGLTTGPLIEAQAKQKFAPLAAPSYPEQSILFAAKQYVGVILIELLYISKGWMVHRYFWCLPLSYVADWLIFYFLLRFYLRYHRPLLTLPEDHSTPVTASMTSPLYEYMRTLGLDLQLLYKKDATEIFLLSIEPGGCVPNHFHKSSEMTVLLTGQVELTVGTEQKIIEPGELVRVPEQIVHGCRNLSQENVLVLSVLTNVGLSEILPALTPEQLNSAEPLPL